MEQMTLLEDTLQIKITKQIKIAIQKGRVPEAKVILDKDKKVICFVANLHCNHEGKLGAYLR